MRPPTHLPASPTGSRAVGAVRQPANRPGSPPPNRALNRLAVPSPARSRADNPEWPDSRHRAPALRLQGRGNLAHNPVRHLAGNQALWRDNPAINPVNRADSRAANQVDSRGWLDNPAASPADNPERSQVDSQAWQVSLARSRAHNPAQPASREETPARRRVAKVDQPLAAGWRDSPPDRPGANRVACPGSLAVVPDLAAATAFA